ncbi:hypothetical protein C5167_003929 [Papaver somniferum]|nr:hypothetical protein C5167_003929 [Papaver somniferum]
MPAVWNGDLDQLTHMLQASMRLDTSRNLNIQNPNAHQNVPHNLWRYCLIAVFFTLHGVNAWHLRCALRKKWRVGGGMSVRQFEVEYYLIRFQIYHEFVRVVRHGSRAILNDIFMISVWHEDQDFRQINLTHVELNITIRGLTLEQLEDFDDVRGYVFHVGEIIAFDQPIYTQQGTYEMTVKVSMNIFNTLRENTIADNGRGGLNTLTFEYHDLPFIFCEFCRRLGHRHEDCAQNRQAQNLVQNGYQLPATPAMYPPLHQQEDDDDMEDLIGNADDEHGFFNDDSDTSSTSRSNHSAASNKYEISITDHNEAILPEEEKHIAGINQEISLPLSPPYVVNPHLWDEFGFYTPEPKETVDLPNPYELTWETTTTSSAKRPNPSHYIYSFLPEDLAKFDPIELYPAANTDPSAASSSRPLIWPTIDD